MNEAYQCAYCGQDLAGRASLVKDGKTFCDDACRDFFETARRLEREDSPPAQECNPSFPFE